MIKFFDENKIFFLSVVLLILLVGGTIALQKMRDSETTYHTEGGVAPDNVQKQSSATLPSPITTTAETAATPTPQPPVAHPTTSVVKKSTQAPATVTRPKLQIRWDDEEGGDD